MVWVIRGERPRCLWFLLSTTLLFYAATLDSRGTVIRGNKKVKTN